MFARVVFKYFEKGNYEVTMPGSMNTAATNENIIMFTQLIDIKPFLTIGLSHHNHLGESIFILGTSGLI